MQKELMVRDGKLVVAEPGFMPKQPEDMDYRKFMTSLGWHYTNALYDVSPYPEEYVALWVRYDEKGYPAAFLVEVVCPYDFYIWVLCEGYPELFEACRLIKPYLDLFVPAGFTNDPPTKRW
jgi:hypothetical protein